LQWPLLWVIVVLIVVGVGAEWHASREIGAKL
jgi:hypothetical protein